VCDSNKHQQTSWATLLDTLRCAQHISTIWLQPHLAEEVIAALLAGGVVGGLVEAWGAALAQVVICSNTADSRNMHKILHTQQ
jgi:hypothetical protein